MKRLFLLVFAVLCCRVALAQAVEPGASNDFRVIARAELFGSSFSPTLYSLWEGSAGDQFEFSVCNHWLTDFSDTPSLYSDILRSDVSNLFDWANVTWRPGAFGLTVGKMFAGVGGFEEDAYDFDSHWDLNSIFWNDTYEGCTYQWGVGVDLLDEESESKVMFQIVTSPYGERPFYEKFGKGLLEYNLYGDGNWDLSETVSTRAVGSLNFINTGDGYVKMLAIGDQMYIGDLTLGIDYIDYGISFRDRDRTILATASYNFNDRFEAGAKCVLDHVYDENCLLAGGFFYWYPLRESTDLRVHLTGSVCNYDRGAVLSLGATWNFSLTDLFRK